MKFYYLLAALALLIFACKKEVDTPPQYTDKIILDEVEENEGSVNLEWSVLNAPGFWGYGVYRFVAPYDQPVSLAEFTGKNQTKFTDTHVPYSESPVVYVVVGFLKDDRQIISNEVLYNQAKVTLTLNTPSGNQDSVILSWEKIVGTSVASYTIMRSITGQTQGAQIANIPATEGEKFIDKSFPLGTEITYQVVAHFANGGTTTSNPTSISLDAPTINLNALAIAKDSVVLNWSPSGGRAFTSYSILRKTSMADAGKIIANLPGSARNFADKEVPYSNEVIYQIASNNMYGNGQVLSNTQTFNRPDIPQIAMGPFDARYDEESQLIYLFERSGKIGIFNIATKTVTHTINTGSNIGFSDIGTYNGKKELYVPREDGWIFIYDPATLSKTGQISAGTDALSVVSDKGILYVSTNSYSYKNIKAISRATGTIISETGEWYGGRLKKIPGTQTSLLSMSMTISPIDLDRFNFGGNGNFISHENDSYHGTYQLDAMIFELFPAGDKMITSGNGSIYKTNMTYETQLPGGNLTFRAYAFDRPQNLIYAASTSKTVEAYTLSGYQHQQSYPLHIFPFKIFRWHNQLMVLGANEPVPVNNFWVPNGPSHLVIEYIDL